MPDQPLQYFILIPTGENTRDEVYGLAAYVMQTLNWTWHATAEGKLQCTTDEGEQFTLEFVDKHLKFYSESMHGTMDEYGNGTSVNQTLFSQVFSTELERKAEREDELLATVNSEQTPLEKSVDEEFDQANERSAWHLLLMSRLFWVTPMIFYACIGVFLAMTIMGANFFDPSSDALLKWGGNYSPLTLGGQYWRLITAVFVHVGIFHLVLNLFGLFFIAVIVEPMLGWWRYLVAYIVCGVLASVTSLGWHTVILSAGASGAIMGIYGLFMALLASDLVNKDFRKSGLIYFGVIIALNLAAGMKGGIDNAAHMGGLITGFIIGYTYYPSLKYPQMVWLKIITPILVLLVGGGITYYAVNHIPNYMATYDKQLTQFDNNQHQALQIYKMPDSLSTKQILVQIDSQGIQLWQQNQRIIDTLGKIPKLPEDMQEQLHQLMVYSKLSEHKFKLEYKRVAENTDSYEDSLKLMTRKVDSVVTILNKADSLAKK